MLNVPKINVLNEIFCIVNFRSFSVKNAILAEIREEIFLAHVFINKKKNERLARTQGNFIFLWVETIARRGLYFRFHYQLREGRFTRSHRAYLGQKATRRSSCLSRLKCVFVFKYFVSLQTQ